MSRVSAATVKSSKSEFKKTLDTKSSQLISKQHDVDINIPITGCSPTLRWPEWSDEDINKERWDNKVVDNRKKSRSTSTSIISETCVFEDEPLTLPVSLKVNEWKRPFEIFTGDRSFVLFDGRYELSVHDLLAANQHLIHSEFMRCVLATFLTVWHLGTNDHFPIEGESATFVSNTSRNSWRPWHHIYSMCKAGKNNQHKPQINPSGKYIIRLYFMGCWRKILVDDKIPVNIDGKILLPLTAEKNELWPLLLTKALLKLACLTWTKDQELVEFNPISCLTGWIVQECDTKRMSSDDAWAICHSYVKQFSDPSEVHNTKMATKTLETVQGYDFLGREIPSIVTYGKSTLYDDSNTVNKAGSRLSSKRKSSAAGNSKKSDKKSSKSLQKSQTDTGVSKEKFLKESVTSTKARSSLKSSPRISARTRDSSVKSRGSRTGARLNASSKSRGSSAASHAKSEKKTTIGLYEGKNHNKGPVLFALMSQHWPMMLPVPTRLESPLSLGHPFVILQTRDSPFLCQKSRPGVPGWKRYRWIDWATKRGLFDPETLLPFRSLQIVSLFRDWFDKIEETDNPDAANIQTMESIHASGDPGGSYTAHPLSSNEKTEADRHGNKIMSPTLNNGGDGKLTTKSKIKMCDSKYSRRSINTQLGGLNSTLSHNTFGSDRNDLPAVPKCGAAIWTDFHHIWDAIDKMLALFKPSSFRYRLNIANFTFNNETLIPRKNVVGDKKQEFNNFQSVTIPYTVQRSRNDGVYLLFDSVEHAKVLVELCTVPSAAFQSTRNPSDGLKSDQEVATNGADAHEVIPRKRVVPVNVVIEAYDWASHKYNETILDMETLGSKSTTLNIGKGRFLLRVWVKTDTVFVLHFLSDSAMTAGNRYQIGYAMCNDSQILTSFTQQLRNKLAYMITTFGKPYFASALHALFQTINDISVYKNKAHIHDVFLDAIVETVKHFVNTSKDFDEYMFALRALFLNVSLGLEKKAKPLVEEIVSEEFGSFSLVVSEEKQVVYYDEYSELDLALSRTTWRMTPSTEMKYRDCALLIQATWKRYCAMKLMKAHMNTQSEEHKKVVERLRKIQEILLGSSATYGDISLRILNNMLDIEPGITKWLPLYRDFGFVVKIQNFHGVLVNITPNVWIPVVRMVVTCHSDTPMTGAVNVVCQSPKYMVRVIDNDNFIEKPRRGFNVEPCMYSKNRNGYTIFVYAWSETLKKDMQWKVQIVSLKNSPKLHPCIAKSKVNLGNLDICTVIPPPTLMTLEVSNYYIPNRANLIFRLLVWVKRSMVTSFRLSTSFSGAKFIACLQDKDGVPLTHAKATEGAVIIPAAYLEMENDSTETLYIIEAKVTNDSWPLTRQEWVVVERLKHEYIPHKERCIIYKTTAGKRLNVTQSKKIDISSKSQSGTKKKKITKTEFQDEFQMEKPYWILQTVIDFNQADFIKVKQDNRRAERVKAMKQAWEEADPGRSKRGQDLRNAFIKENDGTDCKITSSQRLIQLREDFFGKSDESQSKMKAFDDERFHDPPEELAIDHNHTHFVEMISKYFVNSGGDPRVKTREDHERELVERHQREQHFAEKLRRDAEDMTQALMEQRRKHRMMDQYYAKERYESRCIMESAYTVRDDYVRKKIEEEEDRKRLEAFLKKGKKKVKSKQTSMKSSRKSRAKEKGKKSSKSRGASVKFRK